MNEGGGDLQWHNIYTKFCENWSSALKIERKESGVKKDQEPFLKCFKYIS